MMRRASGSFVETARETPRLTSQPRWLRFARRLKNLFVRDEAQFRRLRFGLARGCYVPVNLRHQFRWIFGFYEPEIAPFVRKFVRPGDLCYDIGAAQGYYTVALAKLSAPGLVYAIEADRGLLQQLEETIRRNPHLQSQMSARRAFMGDAVDTSRPATTLDSLVFDEGYKAPNVLKIDVEGAELEVLCGARWMLTEAKPKILLEVHSIDLERDCHRLIEEAGYSMVVVNQNRLVPDNRPIPHNRWLCATAQL
jgi:precorrin-6B methylase 2